MTAKKSNPQHQQNTSTTSGLELGKVPPQAVDMEAAVLGAIMLEGRAFVEVNNILEAECFYVEANKKIFAAAKALYDDLQPIDIHTVATELRRRVELEAVGGALYLSNLTLKVGSAAHVEYHAQIVFQCYIARKVIAAGHRMVDLGFDTSLDVSDMVTDAEVQLNEIAAQMTGKVDVTHVSESAGVAYDEACKRVNNTRNNIRSGVPTGLVDLDKMTCGWQKSNLIVLAARPAMGKTAIMLHLAKTAAIAGTPAAAFSLEMSDVSLSNRLILSECNVAPDRFRSGYMSDEELNSVANAAAVVSKMPIHIVDNCDVTMSHIRSRAKALHKQGKCGIVFIDYLQLVREAGERGRTRDQNIGAMSREAKIIAKELDIPVILLSQLNRSVESREDKKPQLSDLRESGSIEQDADIVMFIWRPEYYGIEVYDTAGNKETNYGELLIDKNRDGATGRVKFKHNVGLTQIFDYGSGNTVAPF